MTIRAAWYDAADRAGDRCECRGACGGKHHLTDTGDFLPCQVRDHWPDVVDLNVTPADPVHELAVAATLPAEQLLVRCSNCWSSAHTLARLLAAPAA